MFNCMTAGFSEMAQYAHDRSRRLHAYAAALEIVNCYDGHSRRLIVVQKDPIPPQTEQYEVVLRARLYYDGQLHQAAEPDWN
jgi:hypothetical protein